MTRSAHPKFHALSVIPLSENISRCFEQLTVKELCLLRKLHSYSFRLSNGEVSDISATSSVGNGPIFDNSEQEGFVQTLKVLPLTDTTVGCISAYSHLPKKSLAIKKRTDTYRPMERNMFITIA